MERDVGLPAVQNDNADKLDWRKRAVILYDPTPFTRRLLSDVLRHAGGMDGVAALLTLYPDRGRAIVILSNAEDTPRFEIRRAVNAILDGQAYTPETPGSWLPAILVLAIALAGLATLYGLRRRRQARNRPSD